MLVSTIPAAFFGRNIFDVFSIYFEQVGQYKLMSLNYPNIWYILDPSGTNSYESLKSASIYLAIAIILVIFIYLIKNKINLTLDKIVYILFISSYTCVLFLPEMHERYGYLPEVFSILSAVLNKKMILPAILINSVGFAAYGKYLYGSDIDITLLSLLNVFAYIYALKILIPEIILKKEEK